MMDELSPQSPAPNRMQSVLDALRAIAPLEKESLEGRNVDKHTKGIYQAYQVLSGMLNQMIGDECFEGRTVEIISNSGTRHLVRIAGVMSSATMLYYSDDPEASFCNLGVRLDNAISIRVLP